jgi:hypothetical protein
MKDKIDGYVLKVLTRWAIIVELSPLSHFDVLHA